MDATWQAAGFPEWQSNAELRLRRSMLLAAFVVAGALSLVHLPTPRAAPPILELIVKLVAPRPVVETEPEPATPLETPVETPVTEPVVLPEPADRTVTEPASAAPAEAPAAPADDATEIGGTAMDLETARAEAIREVLDAAEREQAYSINPNLTRARKEAAVRFRASLAPGKEHIWDHVEKDQMGRTILRDGNCYKVLDDPSVVNRWAFETFDQNTVYCSMTIGGGKKGRKLPWVDIIRERYPYLRDPVALP